MAQATRPGNVERGWNDPPMFLHGTDGKANASTPPRKNLLTKRVFHPGITGPGPMAVVAPPAVPLSIGSVPPNPCVGPPPLVPVMPRPSEEVPASQVAPPVGGPAIFTPAMSDIAILDPSQSAVSADSMPANDVAATLLPAAAEVASLNPGLQESGADGGSHQKQNVVLFPPSINTAVPTFPAPLIIPNMETQSIPIVAPPPPGSPTATGMPSIGPCLKQDDVEIPHFANDKQLFHYVYGRLQKILHLSKTSLPTRVYDDVSKKLHIFESMWDGKISYQVKAAMAKLTTALHEGKCDLAHEIHLQLMMDYVSEVGQWMVAVKRLIQECRSLGPLSPMSPVGSPVSPVGSIVSPVGSSMSPVGSSMSPVRSPADPSIRELHSVDNSSLNDSPVTKLMSDLRDTHVEDSHSHSGNDSTEESSVPSVGNMEFNSMNSTNKSDVENSNSQTEEKEQKSESQNQSQ